MYDYYQPISLLDTMVCTGCCATLDHIVTYLFKQVMMKGKQNVFFVRYRDHPTPLLHMLIKLSYNRKSSSWSNASG